MRVTALALLACAAMAFSNPARVRYAQRVYHEDGHTYIVDYTYSKDLIEGPAFPGASTHRNNPHYQAEISIYELGHDGRTQVGMPFDGYYTELGCVEDNPATLVHRAMSLVHRRNLQASR
jgi:hypothetical protein